MCVLPHFVKYLVSVDAPSVGTMSEAAEGNAFADLLRKAMRM